MSSLKTLLAQLHELTAEKLVEVISKGVPITDEATGEVHYAPAPAAYIAQAINLLKHNNIQAPLGKNKSTAALAGALSTLPDFGEDGLPFQTAQ
jgi:hypothetical protein